ncbi:GntR family transcriptional regulator [Gordonia aichiensis]|uniref:Putative GntR family transcriptional regulator n=1 Tax=Gordonia aichiensis NBRC 108223 TaxID=1220583 RepID=L7KR94_9ACTN|nr:GntR family transcriptional regulator [Gordonia aichiensis]GAC51006.1 putative GntR family transcriptional regulator [Gordonia aichiensis NBRC 108223]
MSTEHGFVEGVSPARVIAQDLRADILEGRLEPGERLVENSLAERFKVSRVPVREALGQLAAEGFINVVRHRGATVSPSLRQDSLEYLQIRRTLEVLATQLAAANRGQPVAAELGKVAAGDVDPETTEHAAGTRPFHDLVGVASGNGKLREMLSAINQRVAWGLGTDWETSRADHAAVARAILSGAEVQAGYLMDEHLRRDEDTFVERFRSEL